MTGLVRILVNGDEALVEPGTTVAAALISRRIWAFHRSPGGDPRGPLCGMGACFECLVVIDGVSGIRACLEPVRDGMRVATDG